MALIAAGMSPYASTSRPAVTYFARPAAPTYRPPVAPSSRYTPPSPQNQPTGAVNWSAVQNAFSSTAAAQQQKAEQIAASQPQPEPEGFWGSGFGKGLGFIINNPVTHVITKPLNYLQTGGRLATLGIEEAAEALQGAPGWAQFAAKSVPVAGQLIAGVDTERTEADKRSNWSKVLSPDTSYGYGELINPDLNKFVGGAIGLGGDILLDPLTYVTGGASRVVAGGSHVDEAARLLDEANEGLRLAQAGGKADEIADAARVVTDAEDYVARAPSMGNLPDTKVPLPRNRIERGELIGELSSTPEGLAIMAEHGDEILKGGVRGFQTMSPEAKAALGIERPGLRLRGLGARIPGTGKIAEALNFGGGAVRQGIANLPGEERLIRNIRTPKGLERAYNILTRGVDGDMLRAGTAVWLRDEIRTGTGKQVAMGNRALTRGINEYLKGKSEDAIRQLVKEAETTDAPNAINDIAKRLLGVYQAVTGREIDPNYLRNPDKYFPHLLDPKFRRALARLAKRGDASALDFKKITGIVDEELLEDPAFYVDNLMGGSGFLSKARKLGTHADGTAASVENPQVIKLGGTEVTFTADDVGHINEQLKKAFPHFEGDFYDTDPVRVFEAYNRSLSRQAGRDIAAKKLVQSGNPLGATMTGDIDATRQAINDALAMQGASPLLSTAQGKYDPTLPLPEVPEAPVVPGSAREREPIQALRTAAEEATDPAEAAALNQQADQLEEALAASRIGGVEPSEYFTHTKGEVATAERQAAAKRAKTYATAMGAETTEAGVNLRQGIYDVREMVINPLKTAVKDVREEIKEVNKRIRVWGKTVKDMGNLTTDNADEVGALLSKVEAEVINAETKLKHTARSWKGAATRAQRKAEADLRKTLDDMYELRTRIQAKLDSGPKDLADEIRMRESILNQPVRDAHARLLEAEMQFARDNPIPHHQARIEGAMDALEHQLANTDENPEDLLQRFRDAIDDVRRGAQAVKDEGLEDTPEMAHYRRLYTAALEDIEEIGGRKKWRGKLTKANQEAMDDAVLRLRQLRKAMGAGEAAGKAGRISPYDEAEAALADARAAVKRAEQAPVASAGGLPEMTPEFIEKLKRGEFQLSDLGKGEGVGDLPRLRAERDRLARQFRPGGRFYEEKKARDILRDAEAWDKEMKEATKDAQHALDQALFQRERTQESIIWKNEDRAGNRYVTKVGQPKSMLEQLGRGVNEQRIVEPIPRVPGEAPQPEAWANVNPQQVFDPGAGLLFDQRSGLYIDPRTEMMYNLETGRAYNPITGEWSSEKPPNAGGLWRPQPIPSPRTEQEAIASLKSLQQTGGPTVMGARSEMRDLAPKIAQEEAELPGKIASEQARVAMEMGARADEQLGPMAERVKTYTNLAQDVTEKQRLVVKRDEAVALRNRLKADPKSRYTDLHKTLDELEAVAKANPYLDDPKLTQVESLLQTHRQELERIEKTRMRMSDLDRVADDAADGKLGDVMIATLNNNWRALHNGPVNTGDIIMDAELYKSFVNLFEVSRQPKAMGRLFNAFTNLFKTYATLSPGFQVRNAIGGVFMNSADGVRLSRQIEGVRLWHKYMDEGEEWLAKQPRRVRNAFDAAFASGAGGRFEETGMLARSQSRLYDIASSNPVTRFAQRRGTNVEGSLRLGMALDSMDAGMSVQGALQRITRVHFDYSQVSQLDETMKRIIPFWTFMSRNLPLQIQEMWTNPRVYSYYDHLVQNFKLPDEEFTPEYWTRQGAWRTPLSIAGAPVYAQPDLGFTRMQQDVEYASKLLSGEDPGLALSQANPLIGATLDFLNKRDAFYGRNYGPSDYKKMSGPLGTAISLLARPLGQTNEAGQVSENFTNYIQSLLPTVNQAIRLTPGVVGEDTSAQTWVKRARWAGIPMQLLTPSTQDSEYWRQYYDMLDEADRQKAMMQEAAS